MQRFTCTLEMEADTKAELVKEEASLAKMKKKGGDYGYTEKRIDDLQDRLVLIEEKTEELYGRLQSSMSGAYGDALEALSDSQKAISQAEATLAQEEAGLEKEPSEKNVESVTMARAKLETLKALANRQKTKLQGVDLAARRMEALSRLAEFEEALPEKMQKIREMAAGYQEALETMLRTGEEAQRKFDALCARMNDPGVDSFTSGWLLGKAAKWAATLIHDNYSEATRAIFEQELEYIGKTSGEMEDLIRKRIAKVHTSLTNPPEKKVPRIGIPPIFLMPVGKDTAETGKQFYVPKM